MAKTQQTTNKSAPKPAPKTPAKPATKPMVSTAVVNVPGAPGNIGAISTIPQGPYTPLPSPGWNPGMNPTNPNFRPSPQMEKIGPGGQPIPWQASNSNAASRQVAGLPPGMYYYDPTPPTKGPAGYQAPGTYNPQQIYNLAPGFQFPSPNLPATTPGLSQKPAPKPAPVAKTPAPAPKPAAKTPVPTPTPTPTPEPKYSGFYIASMHNAKVAAEKAAAEKAAAPTPVAKTPAPAPTPVQDTKQYFTALNARTGVSNQQKVAEFEKFLNEQKLTGKLSKEYLAAEGKGYGENDPRRFDNPYQTAMSEIGGYNIRGAGKDGGWALMGRNSTKVPYQSYVNWEGMSEADKARFSNMDEPLSVTAEERAQGITIRDKALKQGYYDIDPDLWGALGRKAGEYDAAKYDAWYYNKPFSGDLLTSNQGTQSPFG